MAWSADKKHAALVLLILPSVTTVTTLGMSIYQGTHTVFLSDGLNYWVHEPWPAWIVRYALWQSTFAGVFLFKRRMFGSKLRWLAYLNLLACIATQVTGFSQITPATQDGRWPLHISSAMVLSFTFAWETTMLWARGAAAYGFSALIVVYVILFALSHFHIIPDTGIPYIHENVGTPLQWAMLAVHLYLVFKNYERIQRDGFPPARCCGRLVTDVRPEGEGLGRDAGKSLRSESALEPPVAAQA